MTKAVTNDADNGAGAGAGCGTMTGVIESPDASAWTPGSHPTSWVQRSRFRRTTGSFGHGSIPAHCSQVERRQRLHAPRHPANQFFWYYRCADTPASTEIDDPKVRSNQRTSLECVWFSVDAASSQCLLEGRPSGRMASASRSISSGRGGLPRQHSPLWRHLHGRQQFSTLLSASFFSSPFFFLFSFVSDAQQLLSRSTNGLGPKVCRNRRTCLECVWFSDGAIRSPGCVSVGFSRRSPECEYHSSFCVLPTQRLCVDQRRAQGWSVGNGCYWYPQG